MLVEMGGLCIHGINLFYLSSGKFALRLWSPYLSSHQVQTFSFPFIARAGAIGGQAYTSWNA